MLGVEGEQSLYANLEREELVALIGCGHHTFERIVAFACERLARGNKLYGLYGGLHMAPFGTLDVRAGRQSAPTWAGTASNRSPATIAPA